MVKTVLYHLSTVFCSFNTTWMKIWSCLLHMIKKADICCPLVFPLIQVTSFLYQSWLIVENETSHWPFISVSHGFSPRSRPFRRQEAVLSPFILMGEMNVITDYDQFFLLIVTRTYWTHFSQDTYLLNILTQKCHFSDTQIRRKLTLFQTCLCLSDTLSWDLWTGASRLVSQRT